MSEIVWLASYPKSGNTWPRVLLANLTRKGHAPVDIDTLGDIASSRELFDGLAGTEASDLDHGTIERLRPRVYEQLARGLTASGEIRFIKVHDAWTTNADGAPLFPASAGRRVLYIIRNPLDVAVSFSHFSVRPIDRVVRMMGRRQATLCRQCDRLHTQLRQRLLSWSGHVESWVDRSGLEVDVVRYEDMQRAPVDTFSRAARFAGLSADRGQLERACDYASFDELRKQEQAHGFRERGRGATFFREGRVGSWRRELTRAQVERITADHRDVMSRFGYLTAAGTPVDALDMQPTRQLGSPTTP